MSTIQTSGNFTAGPQTGWAALTERRWFVAAVYLTLTIVALYPIFSVTVPPLVDYPNHLARMHILATWDSDPALQKNYVVNWSLNPNMAMQLIVPALAKVMPIYMAGKISIALTMLSILGGTLALRKAIVGRIGLWPVLTFLLLFNHALFWGFLNYLLTAGLALLAFAGWIALRDRSILSRMSIFSMAAFLLYVGHLFGLFIYALLVFSFEAARLRSDSMSGPRCFRVLAQTSIQFILPGLLFVLWAVGNGSAVGATTAFGGISERFSMFISPVNIGLLRLDVMTMVFLAAVWLLCRSDDRISVAPSLKWPLIVVTVVALLMPAYLSGVWGTHLRLPVIVGCLLIAVTRVPESSWRPMPFLLCGALVLVLLRTFMITAEWRGIDGKFNEFRQKIASVERGTRLLPVSGGTAQQAGKSPLYYMQFWHMASLSVIERSVFLPTLFTGHTMVDSSLAVRHLDTPVGNPVLPKFLASGADEANSPFPLGHEFERYVRAYWVGWPRWFDYALVIGFSDDANPSPEYLTPVRSGSFFAIYRVVRPAAK